MAAKKIVLINPYPEKSRGINEATVYPPLGLAYLASYARRHGFTDIKIIDANILKISNRELMRILKIMAPDIVGIQMNVILASAGVELSKMIKLSIPGCLVVIGGPLTSSNPREMLSLSKADIAVIGEGEETFLEILQDTEFERIRGVAFFKHQSFCITPPRPLIENINSIPFPAYDLLPPFKIYKSRARKKPVGVLITSRGCPYQCTFCNASVFGKSFRARSPENVMAEIDMLVAEFHIKQIDVLDDNFINDMGRAESIFDAVISRKYGVLINLQNGVRVDRLTFATVKKMKKAGVFKIGVGIESGDPAILKGVKKGLDLKQVEQALAWFRKAGIITIGFFMIGFPEDTEDSIRKTIAFAIRANPHIANFSMLTPFPGTAMHRELGESGNLKEANRLFYESGFYDRKVYHKCKHLTEDALFALQRQAYSKFNFRLSKMIDVLLTLRSLNELKWTLDAGFPLFKRVIAPFRRLRS